MMNRLFFLTFVSYLLMSSALATSDSLKVLYKEESVTIDSLFQKQQEGLLWRVEKRVDPNSMKLMTYEGYDLGEFFSFLKNKMGIKEIHHIETIANDGYKLIIDRESLNSKGAFLVLKVNGLPKKGIYNQVLKSYFRWEPAYILLDPSSPKVSVASPYQVKTIKIYDKPVINPILTDLDKGLVKGANVFIKTCSKCHQHLGYGGIKAPAIKFMVRRWKSKSDKALRAFLRDPQKTLKRKIQMSAYSGPESDLLELIKFLRSL